MMNTTSEAQRRAFQIQTLKQAAPDIHAGYVWIAAMLYGIALLAFVFGLFALLFNRESGLLILIGCAVAALLFASIATIIKLLLAIERNQRISHELAIRQLERGKGFE